MRKKKNTMEKFWADLKELQNGAEQRRTAESVRAEHSAWEASQGAGDYETSLPFTDANLNTAWLLGAAHAQQTTPQLVDATNYGDTDGNHYVDVHTGEEAIVTFTAE